MTVGFPFPYDENWVSARSVSVDVLEFSVGLEGVKELVDLVSLGGALLVDLWLGYLVFPSRD